MNFNTDAFRTVSNSYINTSDGNNDTQWFINNLYFGSVYYWQVRARNSADSSEWTTPRTFQTRDFVTISSPSNEADVWTGLTLNWNVHVGVSFYDVRVDTSLNFNTDALRTVSNTYINSSDGNNDTQWFINNLYFGQTYYWQVRARNAVDSSAWSEPLTFQTRDFVNKTSPNNTDTWTGLTINWAPHIGVLFYDMQLDTSQSFNSPVAQTVTKNYINSSDSNSDTESFLTDLFFGRTYYWRVRARNAVDTSNWGSVWSFNTRNFVNLTSPADGNLNTTLTPTLNWAPHVGIIKYQQQLDVSNLFNTAAFSENIKNYVNSSDGNSDTQQGYSGLLPNTAYFWRVRAINNSDTSAWTGRWFSTGTGIPSFPQTPIISTSFCDALAPSASPTLSWQAVSGVNFYEIEFTPSNIPFSGSPDLSQISSTSINSPALTENSTYCWSVRAVSNDIAGNWSKPCCFTIPGEPTISTAFLAQNAYCQGDSIVISAEISGNFEPGNSFNVQLSDATGSFSNPDLLGTFIGLESSYEFDLPENTTGNNFRIRIVSQNPIVVGEPSLSFTISANTELDGDLNLLTCLQLNSVDLPQILPSGGSYSGQFVTDNSFSPANAGIGSFEISYSYTNMQGCTSQLNGLIQVDACTIDQEPIQVNQMGHYLNIKLKSSQVAVFQLYNLQGKLIISSEINSNEAEIAFGELPAGLYVFQLTGKDFYQTGKKFIR